MPIERVRLSYCMKPGWLCGALVAGLFSPSADAVLKLDTHLSVDAEYDGNVFRVSQATADQSLRGISRDDEILDSQAGADAEYRFGLQRLYASGAVDRILYQNISQLDRNEFKWLGGMDWKLADVVDGNVEYRGARHMVPEENRGTPSTALAFESDRSGGASANVMVAPEWRVESRTDFTEQDSPSPNARFHLDETKYTLGVKYLGFGPINSGLQAQYLTGAFTDAIRTSPYRQVNLDYTVSYKTSDATELSALVGGSRRRGRNGDNASFNGFTGELHFKRAVSGKTSIGIDAFRRVESYAVLADYVAETGSDVTMDWQATPKIFVNLLAAYTNDSFKLSGRDDHLGLGRLGLNYQPLTWLSLKPAVQYENRQSNQSLYSFTDTLVSLEAKLQF